MDFKEKVLCTIAAVAIAAGISFTTQMMTHSSEQKRQVKKEQIKTAYNNIINIEAKAAGKDSVLDINEKIKMVRALGFNYPINPQESIDLTYKADVNGKERIGVHIINGNRIYEVPLENIAQYIGTTKENLKY